VLQIVEKIDQETAHEDCRAIQEEEEGGGEGK
jgi:hypothetical protein